VSRCGDVWDSPAMESLFSSLEIERVHRKDYETRDQAKANVFDYVERFDHPYGRHSAIEFVCPADFEKRTELA
jgi:putative transposase